MSYHSYRNIGFVFSEAGAACTKWRALFTGFDPQRAAALEGVWQQEGDFLKLRYFGKPYRLNLTNGVLEKPIPKEEKRWEDQEDEAGQVWTERLFMNEALVIYHILGDVAPEPRYGGIWVPEHELDPVHIRSANRTDPLLLGFAKEYAGRLEELREVCLRQGGVPFTGRGDLGFEFRAFPQVPMRLNFWDIDEDFPAQVQMLVDQYATDFMHFEAIGCMFADLFEMLG